MLGLAACTLLAAGSSATMWEFSSMLSGLNEVPPNASPATGTAIGMYDDVTNLFMMDTNASGFVANVTAAHVHLGAPGVAGPIVFPLSGATGSTTYTSHDMPVLTELQEADFLAGNYYVNIHSAQFPGGEVRGQLNPTVVPEPASVVALALGTALLLGLRRRK
jgi:hypothetical protein